MKLVILESPYAGDIEQHIEYGRRCMAHSLSVGEAPFASHLLYTQPGILDDTKPEERAKGIEAGLTWGKHAIKTVVYLDFGFSPGMRLGVERALKEDRGIIFRMIGKDNAKN